jgi:hypothetical protein
MALERNVCFRLPYELRMQALALCETHGIGLSELLRGLLLRALGEPGLAGLDEGYMQARRLAIRMTHQLVETASRDLPDTYEEAVARFGLAGPGVPDEIG